MKTNTLFLPVLLAFCLAACSPTKQPPIDQTAEFKAGLTSMAARDWKKAILHFNHVTQSHPRHKRAQQLRSEALDHIENDPKKAQEAARQNKIAAKKRAASNRAGTSRSGSSATKEPYEYILAVLNSDRYVARDDISVKRFRFLLNKIRSKTGYSDKTIADMTVNAHALLRNNYGKNIKLLTLMEESAKTLSLDSGAKYEEILVLNVQLIGNQ